MRLFIFAFLLAFSSCAVPAFADVDLWNVITQIEADNKGLSVQKLESLTGHTLPPMPGINWAGNPPTKFFSAKGDWGKNGFGRVDYRGKPPLFVHLILQDPKKIPSAEVRKRFGEPTRIDQYTSCKVAKELRPKDWIYKRKWGELEFNFDPKGAYLTGVAFTFQHWLPSID